MAKKNLNLTKLILTGILWGTLYIWLILPAWGVFLGFDFLSAGDWSARYRLFVNGRWQVKTAYDTILFMSMLLFIPVGLLGWRVVYNLKWGKLKPAPRKKKVKKTAFELKESRPLYQMPRRMPSVVQATKYVAPKLPNQQEEVVSGQKSHTGLAQMIRQVATLAKKYKVEVFQHILLEGFRVPMAVSTDSRAVLIEIVNRKKVNWSVEFTDDVTAGGWYSEGGVMERLAQDLLGASKSLAKSEPSSEVLSAILLTDGRILNAKQAVEYFKSKGIFLLAFNNAEPRAELPDLPSFLSAYFDLKEGETDPAPHPVEKVPVKTRQEREAEAAAAAAAAQAQAEQANETPQAEEEIVETEIENESEEEIELTEEQEELLLESEEVSEPETEEEPGEEQQSPAPSQQAEQHQTQVQQQARPTAAQHQPTAEDAHNKGLRGPAIPGNLKPESPKA